MNWFRKNKTAEAIEKKHYLGAGVYYTSIATWSEWNTEKAIKEGFKCSTDVYACVKRRYDAISSLPLVVEEKKGGDWEPSPMHPLQRLLDNPNPIMSMGELMRVVSAHLDLGGNAYWSKVRDGRNEVSELWPMTPYPVDIKVGSDHIPYLYMFGAARLSVPAENVCQFKTMNPDNMYYGQSPLMAAGKSVDADNSAQEWQKVSMQNRGVPDYMISYEDSLTQDQVEQVKERVNESTGPGSAREPIVTSKAKITQLSLTPIEMDFVESRKANRESICSVFGVPSSLIANMGDTNLANAETARKVFWLDTILPLMDEYLETLNRCLTTEFGSLDNLRIVYDTSNVAALQTNLKERVDNAKVLWSMGVPFNEINQKLKLGFDDIDGGDIGYIGTGNIPTSYDFDSGVTDETKKKVLDRITKGK